MSFQPSTDASTVLLVGGAPALAAMQQLRAATRLVHACVEAALPLLDPALTRDRYVRVLQAFHGFYAALEPRIAAAAGAHGVALSITNRAKSPLLARDLNVLGAKLVSLSPEVELPDVSTPSRAVGALYVIEGATLGGQIIRKHLRDRLGIEATTGAAFFNGYGAATRTMWARFGNHVDHAAIDLPSTIETAIETFHTLTLWFEASLGPA